MTPNKAEGDDCKFGECCPAHPPSWFKLGEPLIWRWLSIALDILAKRRTGKPSLDHIPHCAAIHLLHCLETSIEANRRGRHAVAVATVRQCVEALSIVDVGFQETALRDPLLEEWRSEKKTLGAIRMQLARDVWPRYGSGLWSESWAEFFGEFAKAVQPYAHYSPLLQGWQFAMPPGSQLIRGADGNYLFIAQIALNSYDGLKASRITLLFCLIAWATARIIQASGGDPRIDATTVNQLGDEISKSGLLGRGKLNWHQEFWPHMFDGPVPEMPKTDGPPTA